MGIRVVRGDALFAVVAAYHESIRPATILLKASLLGEAVPMKMFLGLNYIRSLLEVRSSSLKWSADEVRVFTGRALRFVKLVPVVPVPSSLEVGVGVEVEVGVELGVRTLKLNDLSGTEGRLVKVKSLAKNVESMVGRRKRTSLIIAGAAADYDDDDDDDEGRDDDVVQLSAQPTTRYNWCSLGMKMNGLSGAGRAGRAPGVQSKKPRRDVGRGIRLTCRATAVSGIHCIYSLYARSMVGPSGPIPVWPPPPPPPPIGAAAVDRPIERLKQDVDDDATVDGDAARDNVVVNPGEGKEERYETESGGSASDDDGDEEEDAMIHQLSSAVNAEVDMKNESFDTIANGAQFDLFVYVPYGGVVADRVVAACSHYTLPFARDAFDTLLGSSSTAAGGGGGGHRELVGTALRSLYRRFYYEASAEEVSQAERAWDLLGREIMLRCRSCQTIAVVLA